MPIGNKFEPRGHDLLVTCSLASLRSQHQHPESCLHKAGSSEAIFLKRGVSWMYSTNMSTHARCRAYARPASQIYHASLQSESSCKLGPVFGTDRGSTTPSVMSTFVLNIPIPIARTPQVSLTNPCVPTPGPCCTIGSAGTGCV